jgi:hypothetical protein
MDLALQIGGVSNEIVNYSHEFCRTWTWQWLLWQGPEAIVQVSYRPILSSERASHIKKPAISGLKKNLVMGSRWAPYIKIDWLTDSCSLIQFLLQLNAWGYNWATLYLGEINTRTWPSRLGESENWDSKIWKWVPWGYKWATLFLGEINTRTWPSRLGESQYWDSKIWTWVLWDSDTRKTALARPSNSCKATNPISH